MFCKINFVDQTYLFQTITENNKTAHASSCVSSFHFVIIIVATHPPACTLTRYSTFSTVINSVSTNYCLDHDLNTTICLYKYRIIFAKKQ